MRLPEYALDSYEVMASEESYRNSHVVTRWASFVYIKSGHGLIVTLYNFGENATALINGITVRSKLKLLDERFRDPIAEFERVFNIDTERGGVMNEKESRVKRSI